MTIQASKSRHTQNGSAVQQRGHYNDMATLLHSPAADFDLQYLKADGSNSNQKQFYTYLGKNEKKF